MKTLLPFFLSITTIFLTTTAEANPFNNMDDGLKEHHLIDDDYQVIDEENMSSFFEMLTNDLNMESQDNNGVQVSLNIKELFLKVKIPNSSGGLFTVDSMLNEPLPFQMMCEDMSASIYAKTNNYKSTIQIIDTDGTLLRSEGVDIATCRDMGLITD